MKIVTQNDKTTVVQIVTTARRKTKEKSMAPKIVKQKNYGAVIKQVGKNSSSVYNYIGGHIKCNFCSYKSRQIQITSEKRNKIILGKIYDRLYVVRNCT